jgi:hypothetical protein
MENELYNKHTKKMRRLYEKITTDLLVSDVLSNWFFPSKYLSKAVL